MFVLITCVFILFGLKERKFTILFSSSSRNLVSFPLSHFLFWANGDCFYFLFLSISWYTFHLHNLAGDLERWKKPQILVRCEIFMDALHLSLCLALFNFLPLMWSYVCSIRVPRITLPFSLLLIILAGSICLLCILSSIWWDWSFYFFFFWDGPARQTYPTAGILCYDKTSQCCICTVICASFVFSVRALRSINLDCCGCSIWPPFFFFNQF